MKELRSHRGDVDACGPREELKPIGKIEIIPPEQFKFLSEV